MLVPYLIQSLNDPKVCPSYADEIYPLIQCFGVAPRQVDHLLDVRAIRQLVHSRYD